jgi:adducin
MKKFLKKTNKLSSKIFYPVEQLTAKSIKKKLEKSILKEFPIEEQKVRVQLAASYRLFDLYGWTDTIYGHLTAKIPNTEHFLINPFGLLYSEITASSLIKVNLKGEIIHPGIFEGIFGINKPGI